MSNNAIRSKGTSKRINNASHRAPWSMWCPFLCTMHITSSQSRSQCVSKSHRKVFSSKALESFFFSWYYIGKVFVFWGWMVYHNLENDCGSQWDEIYRSNPSNLTFHSCIEKDSSWWTILAGKFQGTNQILDLGSIHNHTDDKQIQMGIDKSPFEDERVNLDRIREQTVTGIVTVSGDEKTAMHAVQEKRWGSWVDHVMWRVKEQLHFWNWNIYNIYFYWRLNYVLINFLF